MPFIMYLKIALIVGIIFAIICYSFEWAEFNSALKKLFKGKKDD